jgi:hypothetical protein
VLFTPVLPKRPPPPRSGPPIRAPSGSVLEPRSRPRSGPPEPRSRPSIPAPCLVPKRPAPARSRPASPHAPAPVGRAPDHPEPRSQNHAGAPRFMKEKSDFFCVFFNFLALCVGPRGFLGLERGDKAQITLSL